MLLNQSGLSSISLNPHGDTFSISATDKENKKKTLNPVVDITSTESRIQMVRSDGSSKDLSTAYGIFSTNDASITPIDIQDSIISSKVTSTTDIENYYNTGNIEGWTKVPKGDGRFNNFSSLRGSYDAESSPMSYMIKVNIPQSSTPRSLVVRVFLNYAIVTLRCIYRKGNEQMRYEKIVDHNGKLGYYDIVFDTLGVDGDVIVGIEASRWFGFVDNPRLVSGSISKHKYDSVMNYSDWVSTKNSLPDGIPVSIRDYNHAKGSVKTIIKVDGEWYDMNGNKL